MTTTTEREVRNLWFWSVADAERQAGRILTDDELERIKDALYNSSVAEVCSDVVYSVTGYVNEEQRNHEWLLVEMTVAYTDGTTDNDRWVRIPAMTPDTRIEQVAFETLALELQREGRPYKGMDLVGGTPDLADPDSYDDDGADESIIHEDLRNVR